MAIDVEISDVAVEPLAHMVREPPDRQHIGRCIERKAIIKTEPLLCQHLGSDWLKARIVRPEGSV